MRRLAAWAIMSASGLLALGSPHAAADESVEKNIARLLDDAVSAQTEAEADDRLAQAQRLLERDRGRLDELTAAFLSAEIKRTRGRVCLMAWRRDAGKVDRREQAKRLLLGAREQHEQVAERAADKATQIEWKTRSRDPERNPAYRDAWSYVARAEYALAWTQYNLAQVMPSGQERRHYLNEAIKEFETFTRHEYPDAGTAGDRQAILADCFWGHGLCLYELEHYAEAVRLLEGAKPTNTPRKTFRRITALRLQAYQALPNYLEAEEAAKQYFDSLPADHKLDVEELQMGLDRVRNLAVLSDPKLYEEEDKRYAGFFSARLDAVAKGIDACGEPWRSKLHRLISQTGGNSPFRYLARARQLLADKKYEPALQEAEKGLEAARQASDQAEPATVADLRETKAAACTGLRRWRDAHLAAFDFLQHHRDDSGADKMCTLAVQAGLRALKAKSRLEAAAFLRFLAFAEKHYPDNAEVLQAPWYRASLRFDAKQYREAERVLEAVEPASPVYRRAQYGLALAALKQAEAGGGDKAKAGDTAKRADLLARSAAAVKRYADAADGHPPNEQRDVTRPLINVAVATGQSLLDLPAPDAAATLALLGHVDTLIKALPDANYAADQRRGLRIEAHVRAGNFAEAAKHIDAALDTQVSGPHVARALADVADALENRYEHLKQTDKHADADRLGKRLVGIYDFLLRYVQQSKDAATADQEKSIRFRLARAHQWRGNHRTAISHYEELLKKVPVAKAGNVLRGLAMAYEHTQQWDKAAHMWRRLASGLEKKTERWCEARYHLILCHDQAGRRRHARTLLADFKLRWYPQIASELWQRRFDALERELADDAN